MMYKIIKKIGIITLLFIFILQNFIYLNYSFAENLDKEVLILYEGRNYLNDKRDSVSAIEDLLGHYNSKVYSEKLSKTKSYDFSKYDIIFVLALDKDIDYKNMIEALKNCNKKIIWIGNGIEKFLKNTNYPLVFKGEVFDMVSVSYRKQGTGDMKTFNVEENRSFYKIESLSDSNNIYSVLTDGLNDIPFILESQNLTYISRLDMNEPLFYIFADYLNQILYRKLYDSDKVLISIEDVHIFSDYEELKKKADILYQNKVKFTIGLIPYVRQGESKHIASFTDSSKFIDTLKYMQDKGGSIIIHTYVHKLNNDNITISEKNKNLDNLETYFSQAVSDCMEEGLMPIGYEASHANLTENEKKRLKTMFSTAYGQLFIDEGNYIVYPFELYHTKNFNKFFPINLGYVDKNIENEFGMIESWLDKISLVDGYYGGIYFHSSTESLYVQELINILRSRGITLADPLEEDYFINTKYYQINQIEQKVTITQNELSKSDRIQNMYDELFMAITTILAITVTLFAYILRKSIYNQKKNMFKGKSR